MNDASGGDFDGGSADAAMPALDTGVDAARPRTDGGADAGHDAAVVVVDGGHDAGPPASCATSADCSHCGTGQFCLHGACAPNPTSVYYDFESGAFPTGWTNGTAAGSTPWRMVTSGAHGGTHAIESGAIGANASSGISATIAVASATTVSFWVHTDTESCCDHLQFFIDGALQTTQWSGAVAWTQASFGLTAGSHTIEWRYTKDVSINTGADAVWIDDVSFTTGFAGGTTDFETSGLPPGYSGSGTAPWAIDTTMPHGGTRSAASGTISDYDTSSMITTVVVPTATNLTFWYRVSSEINYDYLHVFIDGSMQGQWSGEVPWTMASYPLAAGTHTVEWRYTKDVSNAVGSDRAWVDDVDFHITSMPGPLCM
jgi:hypothetical protein